MSKTYIAKALRERISIQAHYRCGYCLDPRRQRWSKHFVWVDAATRIAGITAIGRATVLALNLNRPTLVRARGAWVRVGWHPPTEPVL